MKKERYQNLHLNFGIANPPNMMLKYFMHYLMGHHMLSLSFSRS